MQEKIYKMYSNCIKVKGASRSIICDLERNKFYPIPNTLFDIFEGDCIMFDKLQATFTIENQRVLDEYIKYLYDLELIFECDEDLISQFPPLSREWSSPSHITNAIFDGYASIPYFDHRLVSQLSEQCCYYIEIRLYQTTHRDDLTRVLNLISVSHIKCIDIVLKYENTDDFVDWLNQITSTNPKIRCINVHSAKESRVLQDNGNGFGIIVLMNEWILSEKNCGCVSKLFFCVNKDHFLESLQANTCLNKKLSVDKDGYIRNCPSMQTNFGHVLEKPITDVINSQEFKKYWYIDKGKVETCSVCEFRHICTDCRAYIQEPNNIYSKPLKCGYNPYTCEWEEWSENSLKESAIHFYDLKDITTK